MDGRKDGREVVWVSEWVDAWMDSRSFSDHVQIILLINQFVWNFMVPYREDILNHTALHYITLHTKLRQ
jgi:hypothetical protein